MNASDIEGRNASAEAVADRAARRCSRGWWSEVRPGGRCLRPCRSRPVRRLPARLGRRRRESGSSRRSTPRVRKCAPPCSSSPTCGVCSPRAAIRSASHRRRSTAHCAPFRIGPGGRCRAPARRFTRKGAGGCWRPSASARNRFSSTGRRTRSVTSARRSSRLGAPCCEPSPRVPLHTHPFGAVRIGRWRPNARARELARGARIGLCAGPCGYPLHCVPRTVGGRARRRRGPGANRTGGVLSGARSASVLAFAGAVGVRGPISATWPICRSPCRPGGVLVAHETALAESEFRSVQAAATLFPAYQQEARLSGRPLNTTACIHGAGSLPKFGE